MDTDKELSQTDDKLLKSNNIYVTLLEKSSNINNWTPEEEEILLKVSKLYDYKNWKKVSESLPGRSHIQCSARYKRIKPGVIKGSWTQEEDDELIRFVNENGMNWSLISSFMPSRSGKQIRDRYLNILQPGLKKDKFTDEEDKLLLEKYKELGPKWSMIAEFFDNRTGDNVKNRFYSSLRKKEFNVDYLRQKKVKERLGLTGRVIEVHSNNNCQERENIKTEYNIQHGSIPKDSKEEEDLIKFSLLNCLNDIEKCLDKNINYNENSKQIKKEDLNGINDFETQINKLDIISKGMIVDLNKILFEEQIKEEDSKKILLDSLQKSTNMKLMSLIDFNNKNENIFELNLKEDIKNKPKNDKDNTKSISNSSFSLSDNK